jgi:hypothetical protein
LLGGLKGQDFMKVLIGIAMLIGVILLATGDNQWYVDIFKNI